MPRVSRWTGGTTDPTRMVPSARIRAYRVTGALVAEFLNGSPRAYTTDLPADAVATGVWYDHWRGCFYVQFHSESFAPVPEGQVVPEGDLHVTVISPTERTA